MIHPDFDFSLSPSDCERNIGGLLQVPRVKVVGVLGPNSGASLHMCPPLARLGSSKSPARRIMRVEMKRTPKSRALIRTSLIPEFFLFVLNRFVICFLFCDELCKFNSHGVAGFGPTFRQRRRILLCGATELRDLAPSQPQTKTPGFVCLGLKIGNFYMCQFNAHGR